MTEAVAGQKTSAEIENEMMDASIRKKEAQIIRYEFPEGETSPKILMPLAHSDIMFCAVQVIRKGGENNLHSHSGMDGVWFVLEGRVRFYGEGHKVIGEFGKYEGVFIPRTVPYWFEAIGDEPLQLLQAEAIDRRDRNTRTDFENEKGGIHKMKTIKMRT